MRVSRVLARRRWLAGLAALLFFADASPVEPRLPGNEIDAQTRNDVLSLLAQDLESQYAIPEMAKRLASEIRAKQRANAYKSIKTGREFARAVTEDLYAIAHDKHLRVNFAFAPISLPPPGPPSKEALAQMRKENGAISQLEILHGNVGYMRVNGVPEIDAARPAIAAAFAFLHNTDALVIDDRTNGGGDPNTVALYVSYLSEGPSYVVNTFHWRAGNRVEKFKTTDLAALSYGSQKPVFILTSSATFSGGEEMAYDLQALKRAVIVGEVTGGGANPGGGLVQLGKQFVANIPSGQGVNPITGTSWEGVGVIPDVSTSAGIALTRAHELAIARLAAKAVDVEARATLDGVAMELQTIAEAESGSSVRLANSELIGAYVPGSEIVGTTVVILEKEGRLIRHVDGIPDRVLSHFSGNRYRVEGLPDGFFVSFRDNHDHDKTELLLETPTGPSIIRAKRIMAPAQ